MTYVKRERENCSCDYGSINIEWNGDLTETNSRSSISENNDPSTKLLIRLLSLTLLVFATVFSISKLDNDDINGKKENAGYSLWEENVLPSIITTADMYGESKTNIDDKQKIEMKSTIPFLHIDRESYSSPFSSIINENLWNPLLLSASNTTEVPFLPFPTGAFWTNLVLKSTTADRGLSYPIMVYPYGYAWNSEILQVSYPASRRMYDELSIRDIFVPDLTVATKNGDKRQNRYVRYFDPLSVTLKYETPDTDQWWEIYLVQGSPFVTIKYENSIPVLKALSVFESVQCEDPTIIEQGISDDCKDVTERGNNRNDPILLRGSKFFVVTAEKMNWMIITSQPITLVYDPVHKTTVTTSDHFSGIWRMTLLLSRRKDQSNILADYASVYPVGAEVSWEFPSQSVGSLQFRFKTQSLIASSRQDAEAKENNELLMLALPHHVRAFQSIPNVGSTMRLLLNAKLRHRTIKGNLTAVIGSVWSFNYTLPTTGFAEETEAAISSDESVQKLILDQVTEDVYRVLPTLDENVYGYGKQVARLAQLVHIGNTLLLRKDQNNSSTKSYRLMLDEATKSLHHFIISFLKGDVKDYLIYDVDFGGLITIDGLKNSMNDFGNGWYNDHHFHYGYHLYACALLGRWNSSFVAEYGNHIDSLQRDIANAEGGASSIPSFFSNGSLFPLARHKSWFDGHSFASGLFPFASGKSMESSSEAINGYYGAYLWSVLHEGNETDNTNINFMRLLLAMEIQSVQTYWHMMKGDSDQIYDSETFSNSRMVGNLGMMDVTISTWFGSSPLYVHMINFMPITYITRTLFSSKEYLQEEFHAVIEPIYDGVEMAWKGYVVCDKAMALGANAAWNDALKLRSYELDQAISQSQVLFFLSTSDGFDASATISDDDENSVVNTATNSTSAFCYDHSRCRSSSLTGLCCPNNNGINLECCTTTTPDTTMTDTKTNIYDVNAEENEINAYCSKNAPCAAINLTQGLCCPTNDGVFLECCQKQEQIIHPVIAMNSSGMDGNKKKSTNLCSQNPACKALNLVEGLCCPTKDGVFLDCCQQQQKQEEHIDIIQETDSAMCSSNAPCAKLNLTHGLCCPTNDGTFLGCCHQGEQTTARATHDTGGYHSKDIGSKFCFQNVACKALNFDDGLCCPTNDGVFLDCCEKQLENENYPFVTVNDTSQGESTIQFCAANADCVALNLTEGLCCPTNDEVFLECCGQEQQSVSPIEIKKAKGWSGGVDSDDEIGKQDWMLYLFLGLLLLCIITVNYSFGVL